MYPEFSSQPFLLRPISPKSMYSSLLRWPSLVVCWGRHGGVFARVHTSLSTHTHTHTHTPCLHTPIHTPCLHHLSTHITCQSASGIHNLHPHPNQWIEWPKHACENITFQQLRLHNKWHYKIFWSDAKIHPSSSMRNSPLPTAMKNPHILVSLSHLVACKIVRTH